MSLPDGTMLQYLISMERHIYFKHKFLDNIQQFATKMVSTCNLTKQAYLYTIKKTIENLKKKQESNNLNSTSLLDGELSR